MKTWMIGGLALAAGIAACSEEVTITAETTGSSSLSGSSSSGTTNMQGSGGSNAAAPAKQLTADSDMAQHQSITVKGESTSPAPVKVLDGPLFITDVFGSYAAFTTVTGGDCAAPLDQHTFVLEVTQPPGASSGAAAQVHGIRLPILAGQTLCIPNGLGYGVKLTVLGFRPY